MFYLASRIGIYRKAAVAIIEWLGIVGRNADTAAGSLQSACVSLTPPAATSVKLRFLLSGLADPRPSQDGSPSKFCSTLSRVAACPFDAVTSVGVVCASLSAPRISREPAMKQQLEALIRRRDLLRAAAVAGIAGMSAAAVISARAAEAPERNAQDKRRARYQANSAEIQNFYRVNRYPVR